MNTILYSVLNMSITGSLIIAALILLRIPMKKVPKKYSYILWAIPAVRLLCPVSFSSVISLFNIFRPSVDSNRMEYIPPSASVIFDASPAPAASVGEINIQGVLPDAPAPESSHISLFAILTIIWIVGAAAILIFNFARYIGVARHVKDSEEADGYFICKGISTPFVFGILRPKIYLPDGLSESDTRCVIAHERAHIRRKDYIVKFLCVPILALHWFNPLAWLGVKLMTSDMELSCDELALAELSHEHKKEYAQTLLNISMRQNGLAFSGMLGFGESNIKTRIKEVLNIKKPTVAATCAAVAVIAVAAVCLLTNATGKQKDGKLPDEFDGYINAMEADIPFLSFGEAADQAEFRSQTAEKILFQKAELDSCTAYLLGEGVYRDKEDPNDFRAIDLKLGISTDGKTIGAVYDAPAEFIGVSQAHYRIENYGLGYLFAYDLDLPIVELCYHGEESSLGAFYAVKDGEPWLLMGDMSEIGGDVNGQDVGVCFTRTAVKEADEPNTLIFGVLDSYGVVYRFNTENIAAEEYIGPHFTAELVGAKPGEEPAEEPVDEASLNLEAIEQVVEALVDYRGIIGQYDGGENRGETVEIDGELFRPVSAKGYENFEAIKAMLRSAFSEELADRLISIAGITDIDGRAYVSEAATASGVWLNDQFTLSCQSSEKMMMAEIWQEDLNDRGQYCVTQLTLSPAIGYRAACINTHFTSDLDSMPFVPITENTGFEFPNGKNDFELADSALHFFCLDNLFPERINPVASAEACLEDGRVMISVISTTGESETKYATYTVDRVTGDGTDEFGRKINIFADADAPESGVSTGAFESMIVSKINDFIFYERAFCYGALNYAAESAPIYQDSQYLYPVTEKGFTEYGDVTDFLRGLFTNDLAEKEISQMRYKNVDGKTYTYDDSGYGWSVSNKYDGYAVTQDGGYTVVEFRRQLLSQGDEDEYMYTVLKLETFVNDIKIAGYDYHYTTDRFDSYKPISEQGRAENIDIETVYSENEEFIRKEILSAIMVGCGKDFEVSNLKLEKRDTKSNKMILWISYDVRDLRDVENRPYCRGILAAASTYTDPEQSEYAEEAAEKLIDAERNNPLVRNGMMSLIISTADNVYGYKIYNYSRYSDWTGETTDFDESVFREDPVSEMQLGAEALKSKVFEHFNYDGLGIVYDSMYACPFDSEGNCMAILVFRRTGECWLYGADYEAAEPGTPLEFSIDSEKEITVQFADGKTVKLKPAGENKLEVTEVSETLERNIDGTLYTIKVGDIFTAS